MDPLVSEDNVALYLQQNEDFSNLTPWQIKNLAVMVNYFAQGVVTELENFLYKHIKEQKQTLQFGVSDTCRCGGGCQEWKLVDESGTSIEVADSLDSWIR